uniref:Zinc finger, CCHC-type n=1 Tax=Tanacetum cinerariifolium TaxID=118510 RepID=A0A6L2L1S2_TANCI|nr:zinc finger, CCHC-type [Tanacetum cinerariifolium]
MQTLKTDFEMLHMKEDETIDTFTRKLTTLVNKAASLGHTIEDQTLVRKLLNAVPDSKGKHFRGRGKHRFSQGKSHEKFKEEMKDGESSHRNFNRNNFKKSSYDTSKLQCYQCKKIRHISPNCPQRTKANDQSNLVEEDLEPTLLMAILEDSGERNQVKEVEEQKVSLHEEDVGDMTKESGDTSKKEVSATSTPQFQCSMLKPSNYSLWAIRMQIILEANGLWEMIEPLETTKADNKKDKTAIAFLYQALPEEQLLQITKHKTAKAIWDALKTRHIGEERVQQARLQTLKSDFEMLHMKADETIDTFTGKLTTLVNKSSSLGHIIEDQTLVRKLLNVVPDRYLQIVASIEQYSDLSEMTMEEAIGRLKTYKERIKYKKGRKDEESSHRNFNRNNFKKSSYDTSKLQCYQCKKIRHIAPNCPQRTKANEQSNLVEEDLEQTLLMAILEDSNERNQVKEVKEQKVSLHEEDVGYKETNMDSLWYLDNGASNHMIGVREHFKELDKKVSRKVRFRDGSCIDIKGKGSILIECGDEKQRIISRVYYIPSLKGNLLSLGQFTEIGCKIVMEDDELRLYDMDNKIFMKVTRKRNRLYKANLRIGTHVCLLANLKDDTWLWHARLGHLNFESLRSMAQRDLVHGIPAIRHTTQFCDVCLIGKHSRAPFPKKAKVRSTLPLDLVYGDLCGPISPQTPSGKKYIFLLVDDYSRYMWVYILSMKDQAFDTFKEYKKTIENELRTTLKMLRTDRGGEFTSNEFTQYCKQNGIARQLTAPYSPQKNGVVERRNKTIMSTIRCMMKATNMPQNFWAEAVRHAIYILNSVPTKALDDITTYEAIKQRKPNLENLRVFGRIAYTKVPSQRLTKLDDRSEDEPKNYKEASSDQKWIKAIKVELDSINRNNTWELTTLPKGHKAIGLKWVFKTKKDANGNIIKHKARLVAKGYIQEHGIDFKEVFAPIARMETIRLLLVIAANKKWEVHHLNVKFAFLHGDLKEEVWSIQKQATVALSSCESEFITATAAATQALWLKRLLSKLTHSEEEKITIMVDNKSAIVLMKNPVFHERSKHIDTKYHFIRDCVEREDIQVEFISGEYRKADILTKALPKIKFLTMRQLIGLKDLRQSDCD